MKPLSAILIVMGSIGLVFSIIFAFGGEVGKYLGYAIGNAIVFLLPGILLYRKAIKNKTIDGKSKPKQLVCPNGCNVAQQGTNYCGRCGTRLIWR